MKTWQWHTTERGLNWLLDHCAGIKAGEKVLILSDDKSDMDMVGVFCSAASVRTLTVDPIVTVLRMARYPGEPIPIPVGRFMQEFDVVLEVTTVFRGNSPEKTEFREKGGRYISMCGYQWDIFREGGPLGVRPEEVISLAKAISDALTEASSFRIVSPSGTDISGSIAGRKARTVLPFATEPGSYAVPPDVEVGLAPVEGTTEGTLVVDAGVLFIADLLKEPIRIEVKNGEAKSITGKEAYKLRSVLDLCNDQRAYNIAEVALGLNPRARITGIPVETEAALGTAHVALGNSRGYGGHVDAPGHIDMVISDITLYLDGKKIYERGSLL